MKLLWKMQRVDEDSRKEDASSAFGLKGVCGSAVSSRSPGNFSTWATELLAEFLMTNWLIFSQAFASDLGTADTTFEEC